MASQNEGEGPPDPLLAAHEFFRHVGDTEIFRSPQSSVLFPCEG